VSREATTSSLKIKEMFRVLILLSHNWSEHDSDGPSDPLIGL
jgi:hypothetical protein